VASLWMFECGHNIPCPWGMVRPTRDAVAHAHERECQTYAEIMKRVRWDSIEEAAKRFRERKAV